MSIDLINSAVDAVEFFKDNTALCVLGTSVVSSLAWGAYNVGFKNRHYRKSVREAYKESRRARPNLSVQ